jgi:rhodanese-related sulfurtransferase
MKNNIFFALGLVIAIAVVLVISNAGKKDEVSPKYVSDNLASIVLIDVREPEELKSDGYIAGAINIPLSTLQANLNKIPKDKEVVVYCRSGHRSANAVNQLKQLGYTNVKSMAGGINNWKAGGFPVK